MQTAFREVLDLLPAAARWPILFEYVLPIVGQRVDCVLLAEDLISAIEYKGGSSASLKAVLQQAREYALNLVEFHEASRGRTAIPIVVGTFKTSISLDVTSEHQGAAVSPSEFPETILRSHRIWGGKGTLIDSRTSPALVPALTTLRQHRRRWPHWFWMPGYAASRSYSSLPEYLERVRLLQDLNLNPAVAARREGGSGYHC